MKYEVFQTTEVVLRKYAPHPLLHFNGCDRTRRTHTSCTPAIGMHEGEDWGAALQFEEQVHTNILIVYN